MNVVWWSAGVSSTIAAMMVTNAIMIYIEIDDHHPDNERFAADVEQWLGRKIVRIRNDRYRCVDHAIRLAGTSRWVNGPSGAACTSRLKRAVRKKWELDNPGEHTYVWGYDCSEKHRAERIVETVEGKHLFPLIEEGITKEMAHGILRKLGIARPAMYELGYPNNNCIGCIKGGMAYWNKIRVDFPEVFKLRANMERIVGYSCLNGIFLDELDPERGRGLSPVVEECGVLCGLWIDNARNE